MDYDSRDMLVSSDYPLDKIVYMGSGSIVSASGSSTGASVPHELTYRPMIIASWSLDSDFSTSKDAGFPQYADFSLPYLEVTSDYTNINITPMNLTGSTITQYWRAFGFMPPDVNEVSGFTASEADSFVINTEYNYSKLFLTAKVDLSSGNVSVPHNLGYRPQIEIWGQSSFDPSILMNERYGVTSTDPFINRIVVTNTSIEFLKGTQPGLQTVYYYRIYTDEQ